MKRLLLLMVLVAIPAVTVHAQLVTPQLTKPATEAAEGDALHEKYEAAWFRYEKAISEVRDKVNTALDAQFEKAADAGNLDLADMWDKKKKLFLDTGSVTWPSDGKAKVAWRKTYPTTEFPDDFSEVIAAAGAGFEKAVATLKEDYESLVKEYTKGRNLARAKGLRDELAGLARKPAAPVERPTMVERKPESDAGAPAGDGSASPSHKKPSNAKKEIDLLAGLNVANGRVEGRWALNNGSLVGSGPPGDGKLPRFTFSSQDAAELMQGDYDLTLQFSVTPGSNGFSDITPILPTVPAHLCFRNQKDGQTGKIFFFGGPEALLPFRFMPGRKYSAVISVRKGGSRVTVSLDGKNVLAISDLANKPVQQVFDVTVSPGSELILSRCVVTQP